MSVSFYLFSLIVFYSGISIMVIDLGRTIHKLCKGSLYQSDILTSIIDVYLLKWMIGYHLDDISMLLAVLPYMNRYLVASFSRELNSIGV
jgi:hypothetical protein